MATINYRGVDFDVLTSDKPIIFDPPKNCVTPANNVTKILAYIPGREFPAILENDCLKIVALLPDPPKPRRATWLEVARWCATGNGLVCDTDRERIDTGIMFKLSLECEPIMDNIKVRKWSDTEWHEPTVDYLFGGDDADR